MEFIMMNKKTIAVITGLALTLGAAVQVSAQPFGYGGPYGPPQGYGYQQQAPMPPTFVDPEEMLAERFEWLEDRLDIRDDQKSAWQAFTDQVLAQVTDRKAAHKAMRKDRPKDPLEMDQHRIAMMSERLAGMKAIAAARKDLYEVLSDDQREEAADLMMDQRGGHRQRGYRGVSGWYWGY